MSSDSAEHPEVWKQLQSIFQDVFEQDSLEISPQMTAADLDAWDSLSHMELMVEIERSFELRFNTDELMKLANVGEMAALIARKRAGA